MTTTPDKRQVSIMLDAELLDEIDRLSDNRSAVIEEALRLWRNQRIDAQLRQFYQSRSQADLDQEDVWAEFAQQQLEETAEADEI